MHSRKLIDWIQLQVGVVFVSSRPHFYSD